MTEKKYINVDDIRNFIHNYYPSIYYLCLSVPVVTVSDIRENIPAADVAPVIHAHWIERKIFGADYCTCSNCRISVPMAHANEYCGHCGAIMDGKENAQ